MNELTGETIKTILEDVADNLFNPDPYYQQGGDMVRVGGMRYAIDPDAAMGKRITRMELDGKPIDAAQDVQGRRLGAGVRGGEGRGRRADLGRGRALPARAEDDHAARRSNLPALEGVAGQSGARLTRVAICASGTSLGSCQQLLT